MSCSHLHISANKSPQSWIFCVENKFFSSALFEYFRDRVSASKNDRNEVATVPTGKPDGTTSTVQKLDDGWTMEYIANFGNRITTAIDCDNSGFIRISEANTFTEQIPQGWTLPQWCAYTAAGSWVVFRIDFFQLLLYRLRLRV